MIMYLPSFYAYVTDVAKYVDNLNNMYTKIHFVLFWHFINECIKKYYIKIDR